MTLGFLAWIALPILVYVFNNQLGLFRDDRYLWWELSGLIFWIGSGLTLLPKRAIQAIAVLLVVVALLPVSLNDFHYYIYAPFDYNFTLLRENMQPGDVIVVDPSFNSTPSSVWDYYLRVYFPNGLPFVDSPEGYRRVWYVTVDWLRDPALDARVEAGRVAGKYFGPPNFLIRLYEAPPDPVGILFANGMRFHGIDIERASTPDGPVYHEGETVKIRLWWSVDRPVDLDYSVGTYLLGDNGVNVQTNGPPQPSDAPPETSQWEPGRFYIDEREFDMPYPLNDVNTAYPLWLSVYFWQDPTPIPVPGADENGLLKIGQVLVYSW